MVVILARWNYMKIRLIRQPILKETSTKAFPTWGHIPFEAEIQGEIGPTVKLPINHSTRNAKKKLVF
jgi:hypothetical protein